MDKLFKSKSKKPSIAGFLFILSSTVAYGGTMGLESPAPLGNIYVGVFGGGGAVSGLDIGQYGTAFYNGAAGGPLAVNAFGQLDGSSSWLIGGHIGFEWPGSLFNNIGSKWHFIPAAEIEGYYLGGTTLEGDDVNNETTRLVEHNFHVKYPLKAGVFLVNAILNTDCATLGRFHPYLGLGIGSAMISISEATAAQEGPPEPGVNHFNSDPNNTATALALQPKVGLHFDLNPRTTVFVEYRFLYLSTTNYTFGSTVYPNHVATSNWQVKIKPQYYNFGTVGVQFDL